MPVPDRKADHRAMYSERETLIEQSRRPHHDAGAHHIESTLEGICADQKDRESDQGGFQARSPDPARISWPPLAVRRRDNAGKDPQATDQARSTNGHSAVVLGRVLIKIAIVRQSLAAANDMCVAPRVQPIF
jgi:hypothetical protein